MAKENRRTKNANVAVAVAVGDVIALSVKHWLSAMRQDFVTHGGLNRSAMRQVEIGNN